MIFTAAPAMERRDDSIDGAISKQFYLAPFLRCD
jgi:hypothetical protein